MDKRCDVLRSVACLRQGRDPIDYRYGPDKDDIS